MKPRGNRNVPREGNHESKESLKLVEQIAAGSEPAWHLFLERYSGLIYHVVRRHLFIADEDDTRNVYVDILKELYNGGLSNYRGESQLSTWLIVVARRRVADFVRVRYGRRRTPRGYDELSEFDKQVLRLVFVERFPLEIVLHTLNWNGHPAETDDIIESIDRIERCIDKRYLSQLDKEHESIKAGTANYRMLEYMIHARLEYEDRARNSTPDVRLIESEIEQKADRLRELISELPILEQRVIDLRFRRGWSARQISERLNLGGQRRTYTIIDRALRKLRAAL
ncbi:MAG: sigma-70 family RNA polymerase sigma factor [Candidatus Latescibacteria bacterium]|nr:sigma-70 family RNA polymerase sigma factor [Candidatus Latescibacterota bacterium]NIM65790.1 sigma-70 family RNA polymerase sigma factor [Candidatus Latescibacterota bacterium]NIO02283.1 sigma-70 family RNA polymerase sigma factor [Candidatus Latescibacterota bacterium]NIO29154.1 sigma-70 family RNA polymerase sigma factor [Candidatus Latescibacterota bacterium]NIO56768.1 sigma-70 family RNA polymerase sigma factor [Candidatus Latescibacterota bacterium]